MVSCRFAGIGALKMPLAPPEMLPIPEIVVKLPAASRYWISSVAFCGICVRVIAVASKYSYHGSTPVVAAGSSMITSVGFVVVFGYGAMVVFSCAVVVWPGTDQSSSWVSDFSVVMVI